jgi:hypothetical protein
MISVIKTPESVKELRAALLATKKRKADTFYVLGAVSGLGEKAVREIATGKREPSSMEHGILAGLS